MTSSTNREAVSRVRKAFCDGGQGHVFDWWDDLTNKEQDNLICQLEEIDLDLVNRLAAQYLSSSEPKKETVRLEPAPTITLPRTQSQRRRFDEARARGIELIRTGQTAAFVVAGGQSSRLGLKMAKGKFPIMPITEKSLFQHHAEKILALSRKYEVEIPFLIMTSRTNDEETRELFEENDFFGLNCDAVFFLVQGMLPAVDLSGKLILQERGLLFMSPDGHGGSLKTLHKHGALEELARRGIRYLFYFQVDNPLVKVLDPVFLGFHDLEESEMSCKFVEKKDPHEKVGVIGKINGRLGVIEYSDLDEQSMTARDADGRLRFSAGNIAIHLLNVDFIQRCNKDGFILTYHQARKKIPYLDDTGTIQVPEDKNGTKFETFVFDALQYAKKTIALEIEREEEFSPVKNATGADSPATAQRDISALFRRWVEKAGFQVPAGDRLKVEISPLFAYDAEEFVSKVKGRGRLFSSKLFIQ